LKITEDTRGAATVNFLFLSYASVLFRATAVSE